MQVEFYLRLDFRRPINIDFKNTILTQISFSYKSMWSLLVSLSKQKQYPKKKKKKKNWT